MGLVELTGRRYLAAQSARVIGAISWWVFVVACLLGGTVPFGMPSRYVDQQESALAVATDSADFGWTAYVPMTGGPWLVSADAMVQANIVWTITLAAVAIAVVAAVMEAATMGRWPAGVATVVTPICGASVIVTAMHFGAFGGRVQLSPPVVLALVLFGVTIREVWSRAWAPRAHRREAS